MSVIESYYLSSLASQAGGKMGTDHVFRINNVVCPYFLAISMSMTSTKINVSCVRKTGQERTESPRCDEMNKLT